MIIDSLLDFGTVSAASASSVFPYEIDSKAAGDAIDHEMYLVVSVGADAAGTGTMDVQVMTDAAADFSTEVELVSKKLEGVKPAKIAAVLPLPKGCKRYLRVKLAGCSGLTAGTVSAFLTNGPQAGWGE